MVYSTRRFVLYLALCYFVLVFFSPISIARLGKRELILVFFVRLFDLRLCDFVCFLFLFPLPLRVWDWLRLVIVALPGLFSYLFLCTKKDRKSAKCIQSPYIRMNIWTQRLFVT